MKRSCKSRVKIKRAKIAFPPSEASMHEASGLFLWAEFSCQPLTFPPIAGAFDRGLEAEQGNDRIRSLSQRIDPKTVNFQIHLNDLKEPGNPLFTALGLKPQNRIG